MKCFQLAMLAVVLLSAATLRAQATPKIEVPPDNIRPDTSLIDDVPPEVKSRARAASIERLPEELDDMIAQALESNPEIQMAEAALSQAEAELNQTRLRVTHSIIGAFRERELELQRVAILEAQAKSQTIGRFEVLEARQAVEKSEASLRYLLGVGGRALTGPRGRSSLMEATPGTAFERPALSEAVERKLQSSFSVNAYTRPGVAHSVLQLCHDLSKHIDLPIVLASGVELEQTEAHQQLGQAPVRDIMQAVADAANVCFVFRDYGVLVTRPAAAEEMAAPTIPAEIPLKVAPPSHRSEQTRY